MLIIQPPVDVGVLAYVGETQLVHLVGAVGLQVEQGNKHGTHAPPVVKVYPESHELHVSVLEHDLQLSTLHV